MSVSVLDVSKQKFDVISEPRFSIRSFFAASRRNAAHHIDECYAAGPAPRSDAAHRAGKVIELGCCWCGVQRRERESARHAVR